ncbi:hypothetical protein FQR65_LT16466 [Abscondita terminalis]|nr:hypothetical protein FQR65_LT16466 [Abscondita terminalis]
MKKTLHDIQTKDKVVLVRVDFNVPIKDGVITDDNRIKAAMPTINHLIEKGAKIVLFSHLSRIKEETDKAKKSLAPVAKKLEEISKKKINFISQTRGTELETAIKNLKSGEIILVENTRFEDVVNNEVVKNESKNSPELAHRAHASNVGISSNIKESCVGFLVQKELEMLSKGIDKPEKPFVAIIGGAKVSDKIGVIDNLLTKADHIIIGGGMAYTFFKAQGHSIGKSLCEEDKVSLAKEYLDKANGKIILPIDSANAESFADVKPQFSGVDLPENVMGLDIGPKSIELFQICEAIANLKGAFTLIGGGDSAAAAIQLGFSDKFTHISTGGGASLEFMEGKVLPGVEAIQNK